MGGWLREGEDREDEVVVVVAERVGGGEGEGEEDEKDSCAGETEERIETELTGEEEGVLGEEKVDDLFDEGVNEEGRGAETIEEEESVEEEGIKEEGIEETVVTAEDGVR